MILKTIDGGTNWFPQKSETNNWLRSVYFKDSNMGWTIGNSGLLLMTIDGGDSWSPRKTWTNKMLKANIRAIEKTKAKDKRKKSLNL